MIVKRQSVENIGHIKTLKHLEKIGRVCYKSEDKITEISYVSFIDRILKNGHLSVLEHLNIIFVFRFDFNHINIHELFDSPFIIKSKINVCKYLVSGSLRAFYEYCMEKKYYYIFRHITIYLKDQFILSDDFKESKDVEFLKYFFIDVIDEELLIDNYVDVDKDYLNSLIEKHITHTFYIECDRGISHQIVRHRWTHAVTMESTRYVKYNQIEVILTNWFYNKKGINYYLWYFNCWVSEKIYKLLIKRGLSTQKARNVLPQSLKTSLYSTMSLSQWKYFLELRMGKDAHPQIIELSENIFKILKSEYSCVFSDFSGK